MKNLVQLKKDVSTIEQFAINNLIAITVLNLGFNSKTPIGSNTGSNIEVNEVGDVVVNEWFELENLFLKPRELKDYPLTEMIQLLNMLT